jgi:L-lactate dehydrogenase complex protein LldE
MVRHHYAELFTDAPAWQARAMDVARKTFELTEFLVDVLGVTDLGARFDGRVTYHDSCHLLRTLGVRAQPRALLSNIRGLDFVEMADSDRCCGFGGTFSVKYPEISTAMVAEKVDTILATGADPAAATACRSNISRNCWPLRRINVGDDRPRPAHAEWPRRNPWPGPVS